MEKNEKSNGELDQELKQKQEYQQTSISFSPQSLTLPSSSSPSSSSCTKTELTESENGK